MATTKELLKEEYQELYELSIPRSDEEDDLATAYLKKPNRKVLAVFMSKVNMDPLSAYEMLLKNCWIKGDEEIMESDEMLLSACTALEPLVSFRQGTLKKI
ncbi:MAG: hypothetical protein MI784_12135 [Cytophagales bacterium]|nr:hypothetical protein [Cytophagales bacterium]